MTNPQETRTTKNGTRTLWLSIATVLLLAVGVGWSLWQKKEPTIPIMVYKSPTCECCNGWITHLRNHGFAVTVKDLDDTTAIKKELGIPDRLASCHTGLLGDYLVEGHVPAQDLHRLLRERPAVRGITTSPGMPVGSPGMEIPGQKPDRYDVVTFTKDGKTQVFSQY